MITISIEFDQNYTLPLKIPSQTTVGQLTQLTRIYQRIHFKYNHIDKKFVYLTTKNSHPIGEMWLTYSNKTLKPFGDQIYLYPIYKIPKLNKTEAKNYVKIQKIGNSATVVRRIKDLKIYVIRRYQKQSITSFSKLEKIIIIKEYLIKFKHISSLPKICKTFEAKYSFNLVLQYVPFQLKEIANKENIKILLRNLLKAVNQLAQIGISINEVNLSDLKITFDLQFKLVKLSHLLSINSIFKVQNNLGLQFYRLIHQMFNKLGLMSSQKIGQIYQESYNQIQFFLGSNFKKFMNLLKSKECINLEQILALQWLTNIPNAKIQLCHFNFSHLECFFNSNQTTRVQFEQQQNFSFEPITNFFQWEVQQKQKIKNTEKKAQKMLNMGRKKTRRLNRAYFGCPYSKLIKIC